MVILSHVSAIALMCISMSQGSILLGILSNNDDDDDDNDDSDDDDDSDDGDDYDDDDYDDCDDDDDDDDNDDDGDLYGIDCVDCTLSTSPSLLITITSHHHHYRLLFIQCVPERRFSRGPFRTGKLRPITSRHNHT